MGGNGRTRHLAASGFGGQAAKRQGCPPLRAGLLRPTLLAIPPALALLAALPAAGLAAESAAGSGTAPAAAPADPAGVGAARTVRDAILALPPEKLEQSIDIVGRAVAGLQDTAAMDAVAASAMAAVDRVAADHPQAVEEWWAEIIKDSIGLAVRDARIASAGASGQAGGNPVARAFGPDLRLDTSRRLIPGQESPSSAPPAPPAAPAAASQASPRQPVREAPPATAEAAAERPRDPAPAESRPPRRAEPERPVELAPPPRTLDQQLAEKLARERLAPNGPSPVSSAVELLRRQGLPITTDTLNRAMNQLSEGCAAPDGATFGGNAASERCQPVMLREGGPGGRLIEVEPVQPGRTPAAAAPAPSPSPPASAGPGGGGVTLNDIVRGYADGSRLSR